MSIKHLWQTCVALLGVIQLSQSADLCLFCNDDPSRQDNLTVPLSEAMELVTSDCYDKSRANCFYAFGFAGKPDGLATITVISALIRTKVCNTFLLNWEKEASAIQISEMTNPITKQISYVLSGLAEALNVGVQLGNKLVELAKNGFDLLNTYLIGHSLGAQLMGIAGRTVRLVGLIVRWIFGLDPAGPFYNNPPVMQHISAKDGEAVFCIHTDPGDYGTNKTACTVDLLMNFLPFTLSEKKDNVQPGCPKGVYTKFSKDDLCSHDRSWMYFAEALENPFSEDNFLGCKAKNVYDFEDDLGDCSNDDTLSISLNWEYKKKRGIYFADTKSASPYDLKIYDAEEKEDAEEEEDEEEVN